MAGSVIVGLVLAYFVAIASATPSPAPSCSTLSGNVYNCTSVSKSGTQCYTSTKASSSGCTASGFYTYSAYPVCQCAYNCSAYPSTPFEYNATAIVNGVSACVTASGCLGHGLYGNAVTGKCVTAFNCQNGYYGDSVKGNCVASCPTANGDNAPYLDPATNICESLDNCGSLSKYVNLFAGTCITQSVCSQSSVSNGVFLTAVNNSPSPQGLGNYCQCPTNSIFADYPSSTCNTAAECLSNLGEFGDPTTDSCVADCPANLYADADNDAYEGLCVTQTQCASIGKYTDTGTGTGKCVVSTSCTSPFYADPVSNTCVQICPSPNIYVDSNTNECTSTPPSVPILYYTVPVTIASNDVYTQIPDTSARDCLKYDDTTSTFTPGYTIFSNYYGAKLCCNEIGMLDSSSSPPCQQAKCGASLPVDGESVDDPSQDDGTFCFGNCYSTSQSQDTNNQYNTLNNGNNPLYFNTVVAATSVSSPKAGYAVTNRNGLNSGWVITTTGNRRGVEHVASGSYLCLIKGAVSGGNCEYSVCGSQATETPSQGYFSYTPNGSNTEECYLRCYGH